MNILGKNTHSSNKKGFTLIELMVVIAIVVIFVGIILGGISTARQNAREKQRIADLGSIELGLTLYKASTGAYPVAPTALEIGKGGVLDAEIVKYMGGVPKDPLTEASAGGTYSYWYDSDFLCKGKSMKVVYVKTMEQLKNANYEEVCGGAQLPHSDRVSPSFALVKIRNISAQLSLLRDTLIPKAYAAAGTCWIPGGGNCAAVCAGAGGGFAGQCMSGEDRPAQGLSELGGAIFTHGCYGACSSPSSAGSFQTNASGIFLCYYPGQVQDSDATDITVACQCNVVDVSVCPTPPPIGAVCDSFTATPVTLPYGGGVVNLAWTTTDATGVTISGVSGALAVDGSRANVPVVATQTFALTGTGTGASCTRNVTVTVGTIPPEPPVDTAAMYIVVLTE
jgi:prepilin-type N-terminal cleavage/methylation domain-containing protein